MRAILYWTDKDNTEPVEEKIDVPPGITVDSLQKWAEDLIDWFNEHENQLPQGRPRTLAKVEPLSENPHAHDWHKTSLVAMMTPSGVIHDTYKCERCGITGKRYGTGYVIRDSKYRHKCYSRCDTAIAHLEKKKARTQK